MLRHFNALYLLSRGLDMGQAGLCMPVAKMGIWAGRDYTWISGGKVNPLIQGDLLYFFLFFLQMKHRVVSRKLSVFSSAVCILYYFVLKWGSKHV